MDGYRLGIGVGTYLWCKDMGKGGGHGWGTDQGYGYGSMGGCKDMSKVGCHGWV